MIFVDTNVLYSVLVKTKFSKSDQDIILMPSDLATSATVLILSKLTANPSKKEEV